MAIRIFYTAENISDLVTINAMIILSLIFLIK